MPLHIGSVVVYDQSGAEGGVVRFKQILAHIEDRLRFARCFRQKLVHVPLGLDHPYWVEDADFDLEYHVRHIALPKPGDWRQLCIQTSRLMSRPLDMSRPLWEMTVIEGLDAIEHLPPGCFAIVTKIHHAAIDGMSGAEIFAAMHDLAPDEGRPGTDEWEPEANPDAVSLLARAGVNSLRRPLRLATTTARALPAIGGIVRRARDVDDDLEVPSLRAPLTRFNGRVSAHRVFDGRALPLPEVKRLRRAVEGATVNDVVLTIVGGALREYLLDKGELPDESLIAAAPVSVRTDEQAGSGGNQVSAMFPRLHTEIADPVARLASVRASTSATKLFTSAIGARTLTDYAEFGPMRLAGLAARAYLHSPLRERGGIPTNCIVTNVPGPPFPLYFGPAEVVALYGLGPVLDGVALIHPVFSYLDTITISFTSCREILPDPGFYADCIQRSFEQLRAAVAPPKPSRARRPTTKKASRAAKAG